MKAELFTFLALGLVGIAQANTPKVVIISPNDLVEAWQGYAKGRTSGEYSVVNADEIYSTYSYATGETGAPRNPAESIHTFIRDRAAEGVGYFMLGGAWFDGQNLEKKVYFQGTEVALGLDNAIPGVYQYAYNDSASPSDLFYACLGDTEGYPWDADGDGKYLNDVVYTEGTANYDLTPDVVVSRVSLKSATGMDLWGIKINEGSTNLTEMVAAFSAKVAAAEAKDFAGRDKYALVAGAVNDNLYQPERKQILPLFEREYEFYDGLPNFGDPAHGNTGNATTELLVRRRLRDQIATVRPVVETDILSSGGWAKRYGSFAEAVAGYRANSHVFDMMYSHGLISGGEVWGLSVGSQFLHPGHFGTMTGLNLFADYAGPCFGGVPDNSFTRNGRTYADFSCVEAMIANPAGGAVAAVGNARSGIYEGSYTVDFDNDFSWKLANRMLVNFIREDTTAGEAWKNAIASYVEDKTMVNGTHVLIIAQEMLYGDPLVKLPAATPDPALVGIETAETALLIGEGRGHGGQGVVFAGEKGKLTLEGETPYYLGGLTNGTLEITGNNKTIDLDACQFEAAGDLSIGSSVSATTLRSTRRGCLASLGNNLYLRAGVSVELDTWDAFGDTAGTIQVGGAGAEIVIGPNLCYPERDGHGESLNANISFITKRRSLVVRVKKGGLFTPVASLRASEPANSNEVSYQIDSYDGLRGVVKVPANAKLTLKDIPLAGTETLTVESGATLVLPEGASLDELVSTGMAYLKAGALIAYGEGTPTALVEDKTVDGSTYVQKYYYGTEANWESSTKVSRKNGGACEITPTAKDIVVFAQGERFPVSETANAYFKQTTVKTLEVANGTRLYVGAGYGGANNMSGRSLVDGYSVFVEGGSSVHIAGWNHVGDARTFGMDGTVTFNGEGEVHFSNWDAKSYIVENVKGSAVLVIEEGVTVKPIGVVENALSGAGKVVVTSVAQTYTVAPGWEGTFEIADTSVAKPYEPKYEQLGEGLVRVTFVEREPKTVVIDSAVTWAALPEGFVSGDSIEVAKDGELTLTFAMAEPVIGSGRVVTTVSPSAALKESLKADTWTGTFVLKDLGSGQTDMKPFNPSNYGTTKSRVELLNCACYFPNGGSTDVPLAISGTLNIYDGYGNTTFTVGELMGTGAFVGGKYFNRGPMTIAIQKGDGFYGKVAFTVADNNVVIALPETSPSMLAANGYLTYSINADGAVQDLAVTEKARPAIDAFTLGTSAKVTVDKPIEGLTYLLKSAETLGTETWGVEATKKAESSAALTLEIAPSESASRFYKVEVTF